MPHSVASTFELNTCYPCCSSIFIYPYTNIKIIFVFECSNLWEESASDMFMCHVNHHDFLPVGRHWTRGWVGPKVPSGSWTPAFKASAIPYTDRAIMVPSVCQHYYYYYYHHHHHPYCHLYIGYLQLYTCNKPCF